MGKRTGTVKIPCKAPGCIRRKIKRGYCDRHYQQWFHHGKLLPTYTHEQRFWSHVNKRGPTDCWPWTGATNEGYGIVRMPNDQTARAHRAAYEYAVGPIPAGKILDHICHIPELCTLGVLCPHRSCCNPQHLKPVTHLENSDPSRAVRDRGPRVSACPRGHEYTPENTRTDVRGGRHCCECESIRRR